jgi:hypothetical protein
MKIGIIIIFHDNEEDIDKKIFVKHSNKADNLEICLVNNDSRDNTFQKLLEIKEECSNVSVVNIKKFKSERSAVRSGARYMFNQFELHHIGYLSTLSLNTNHFGLNELIKAISENHDVILNFNIKRLEDQKIKQTLFNNLFSVIEYLIQLNVETQFVKLQYQNKL